MNAFCKLIRPLILLLAVVPLSQAAATWTTIDVPGATATFVSKINNSGQMVGYFLDARRFQHGFLLSGGTFTTIDFPGARRTIAWGINDLGQIVGEYRGNPGKDFQGSFLLSGGIFTTIQYPGSTGTHARDINNSGQIVGDYSSPGGQGFIYEAGVFTKIRPPGASVSQLLGINNFGYIVGNSAGVGGIWEGFVYSGGSFEPRIFFPESQSTAVYGVNDRRQVVGSSKPPLSSDDNGFVFLRGSFVDLNYPGARSTTPSGINLNGDAVGGYTDQGGVGHGFLRTSSSP